MSETLSFPVAATLGNITGPASDGVLIGQLTATDPDTVLLKGLASTALLCITDDGGLYVSETTPIQEATADDVEVLPATPAVDDACYFGHATETFAKIALNETTQGAGTWTILWEYWNGTAWASLAGVTDGTTGFTAAAGWVTVVWTLPSTWAKCTVDGVDGYWVRGRVSAYTSITTAPQIGQGYIYPTSPTWTDDTTDFTDAGASDCAAVPAYPGIGDGLYIGYSEPFTKVKVTIGTAGVATWTVALKYWDGSAWTAVTAALVEDDTAGWTTGTSTYYVHFVPPSDWTANTATNGPNSQTGYFVVMEITAFTSMTTQPLITQGWVLPVTTSTDGFTCPYKGTIVKVSCSAQTASATNADSVFLLMNFTQGTSASFTWTKADPNLEITVSLAVLAGDELGIVQITEDGTTEFANATFMLTI